jgi:hypothetical protein
MPRSPEVTAPHVWAVLATLLAASLGACAAAHDDAAPPAAPPAASAPAPSAPTAVPSAASSPAVPVATPPAAPAAPRARRPLADFEWPQPLPPCSPDAPFLFKGMVIGSWVPEGDAGFDQAWVDESGLREAWTRASVNRRTWKGFNVASPTVLADSLLADRDGPAVGYVFSLLSRADGNPDVEDQPAVLHLRHRGRVRVLIDGLRLLDEPAPAGGEWAEARAPLMLSGPYTVVLLKLGRGSADLGASMEFELRVSAPDGSPLPKQSWNTMRPGFAPPENG